MIRIATVWDQEDIIAMLEQYRNHSPLDFHKTTTDTSTRRLLTHIWAGAGVCFLSEDNDGIHGMLLAIRNPNIWNEQKYAMHELAYWVNPERRGSSAGYRLLKAYDEYCKNLKSQGSIEYYTVSKMVTSPDLDYSRFGFNRLEEMWSQ